MALHYCPGVVDERGGSRPVSVSDLQFAVTVMARGGHPRAAPALRAPQLSAFLAIARRVEPPFRDRAGWFLFRLIQRSFEEGENDFRVDTSEWEYDPGLFAQSISGQQDRTLNLCIDGPWPLRLGARARHLDLTALDEGAAAMLSRARLAVPRAGILTIDVYVGASRSSRTPWGLST